MKLVVNLFFSLYLLIGSMTLVFADCSNYNGLFKSKNLSANLKSISKLIKSIETKTDAQSIEKERERLYSKIIRFLIWETPINKMDTLNRSQCLKTLLEFDKKMKGEKELETAIKLNYFSQCITFFSKNFQNVPQKILDEQQMFHRNSLINLIFSIHLAQPFIMSAPDIIATEDEDSWVNRRIFIETLNYRLLDEFFTQYKNKNLPKPHTVLLEQIDQFMSCYENIYRENYDQNKIEAPIYFQCNKPFSENHEDKILISKIEDYAIIAYKRRTHEAGQYKEIYDAIFELYPTYPFVFKISKQTENQAEVNLREQKVLERLIKEKILPNVIFLNSSGDLYQQSILEPTFQKFEDIPESRYNKISGDLFLFLHNLHQSNIIHFDIKPQNIMLLPPRNKLVDRFLSAVLIDYGLSEIFNPNQQTLRSPLIRGTAGHLSPDLIDLYAHSASSISIEQLKAGDLFSLCFSLLYRFGNEKLRDQLNQYKEINAKIFSKILSSDPISDLSLIEIDQLIEKENKIISKIKKSLEISIQLEREKVPPLFQILVRGLALKWQERKTALDSFKQVTNLPSSK